MRQSDSDRPGNEEFEPLVRVGDLAEANVLAARLRSEGIAVRMHGEPFGPYPVGLGSLAEVEIWVDRDRRADARAVLDTHQER